MTQEQKERSIASYYENVSMFNAHNGIRLVDVDDHYGVVEVTLTQQSLNPLKTVHGGLIFSLLDVATGVAARSCGRMTVTQNANIYYLRPGKKSSRRRFDGSFPLGNEACRLLHAVFVGLDHLLDHLAADAAGLLGGQVAVITLLEVHADLVGSLHLKAIHRFAGIGVHELVAGLRHCVCISFAS